MAMTANQQYGRILVSNINMGLDISASGAALLLRRQSPVECSRVQIVKFGGAADTSDGLAIHSWMNDLRLLSKEIWKADAIVRPRCRTLPSNGSSKLYRVSRVCSFI